MKKRDKKCWLGNTGAAAFVCAVWVGARFARACAIRLSQLVLLLIDFSGYILLSTGASPPLPAPLIEPTPLLTSPLLLLLNPQPFGPALPFVLAWKSFGVALQREILRKMSVRRSQLFFFLGGGLWAGVYVGCLDSAASAKPLNFQIAVAKATFAPRGSSDPLLVLDFFLFCFRKNWLDLARRTSNVISWHPGSYS